MGGVSGVGHRDRSIGGESDPSNSMLGSGRVSAGGVMEDGLLNRLSVYPVYHTTESASQVFRGGGPKNQELPGIHHPTMPPPSDRNHKNQLMDRGALEKGSRDDLSRAVKLRHWYPISYAARFISASFAQKHRLKSIEAVLVRDHEVAQTVRD